MIAHTSAIIAIFVQSRTLARLRTPSRALKLAEFPAVNFVEAARVIDGSRDPVASRRFHDLIWQAGFLIEPVTQTQARIAREAYRDFGTGSGHPAGLNLGDCFAYALAKETSEAILFKGDDFRHTDLRSALA